MIIHLNHLFSRSRLVLFLLIFFDLLLCCIQRRFLLFAFLVWFTKLPQFTISKVSRKLGEENEHFPSHFRLLSSALFVNFPCAICIVKKNLGRKRFCSQNSPIVFGSIWYAGMPQWAGGGVVRWSPLWQKNGVNPILFACKDGERIENFIRDFTESFDEV